MKNRLLTLRSAAFLLFFLFLLVLLLVNSKAAMDGVRRGLSLCTETLFPSLFPFLVLSELLVALRAGDLLGKWLARPLAKLFGLSEGGAVALLLGGLCGFPVGATTAISLCERGDISEGEVRRLLLFANNPSSGFLIGAVGGALFGNSGVGVALFLMVWISSTVLGIGLRILCGSVEKTPHIPTNGVRNSPSVKDFTGSVARGFSSMLQVFAFVLFFSCISGCVTPMLQSLQVPLNIGAFLCGCLEMTFGISNAVTTLSPVAAFRFTAFFAGFAGLSVCLQLFSVAERCRPRLLPYLVARLLQGGITLGLAECYLRLWTPVLETAESMATFAENTVQQGTTLGILLLIPALLPILKALEKRKNRAAL